MSRIAKQFSAEDLRAVEAAVERSETSTSGEVVTYIASSSDAYHLAAWKAATFGAVLFSLAAAAYVGLSPAWGLWIEAWLAAPALSGAATGYLLGRFVPWVRRGLIDSEVMTERTERRAHEVFLSEEVFRTRQRTGVLIFVSLFERRVVLLPDSGIRDAVPEGSWETVVDDLVGNIRAERAAAGLVEAVEACGRILARYRPGDPGNLNELDDRPRVEEAE